jgi:GNAT superfamily N-acetyltransferase
VTPAGLEITRVEPGEGIVGQLLRRYYEELDARFPDGFAVERSVAAPPEDLAPPHGAFLVARLDGEPDGATAEIKRMWISPAARGRGVARRLLGDLEGVAGALGCTVVRLDTSAHLTEAIGLYRSSGYVDIPAYNDNLYAGLWLEKLLD